MTALHIKLAPDYQVVGAGLGYELRYQEPARLQWVTLAERATIAACEQAYLLHQEGELIDYWEEEE